MKETTRIGMGRGALYLLIANGVLVVASYVVQVGLGRYLGPGDYGIFGVIIALMTIVNTFFSAGFPQSASKYIAEDDTKISDIIKNANRITLSFCALIFILYFSLAGVIANLFNDPNLTSYIRISALAIPAYAFYSIYGPGYLNGLRQFGKQAIASFGSSIAKVAAVFVLVILGFGVKGAIVGYFTAATVGFLIAWRLMGRVQKRGVAFEGKKLVQFGIPATAFAVAFFLLMSIDLFAVKAIGAGEVEVGYYTAASTISKVPYFLLAGLAMALLPSISRSTSMNDVELTRNYISNSMRYMLMLLIPGTVLVSATSADVLTLFYSSTYVAAAPSLRILIFGLALLSVFFVLVTIIIGSGKPGVAIWATLPLIAIDIVLNIHFIPKYGLVGAAWATTITGFLGVCAAAVYVLRTFKTLVSVKSLGKICLASTVIYFIALKVSFQPSWLPAVYVGLFVLYSGILWLLRELNKEDMRTVRRVVPLLRLPSITANRTS